MGFSAAHPEGKAWMQEIEKLKKEFNRDDFPVKLQIIPFDLAQLGHAYIETKGRENEFTKYLREEIEIAIK